jgi:hypothetical protein
MAWIRSRVLVCPLNVLAFLTAAVGATAAHATVTISSGATQNMNCSSGVCTATAANAVLNVGDLTTMLASSSVQVNTGSGSLGASVEDIIVAASFNWASANALTLDAYRSVSFQNAVADNGSGAVSLVTNDGGSGGTLSFILGGSLSFLGTTNSLSINGKTYKLVSAIETLAADIKKKPSGFYALSTSYKANHDGAYKNSVVPTQFGGTFNGLGNTISNLTLKGKLEIKKPDYVGLFSDVLTSGAINSLHVTNANVSVNDSKYQGAVNVGVIAGLSNGTIFNSFASGQIAAKVGKSGGPVGGLVGGNVGNIISSASTTTVAVSGSSSAMGASAGGLAGTNTGTMEGSFATGNASVTGGIVGSNSGGLVGFSSGPIDNCYAEGAAALSTTQFTGGLVGYTTAAITRSYSMGAPSAGSGSYIGGFVGYDEVSGSHTTDYWDTTTSGITNLSQGAGNIANDPGITGQTTAQLQAGLPPGFDPTIWAENPSINNGLPYLIANPPQ